MHVCTIEWHPYWMSEWKQYGRFSPTTSSSRWLALEIGVTGLAVVRWGFDTHLLRMMHCSYPSRVPCYHHWYHSVTVALPVLVVPAPLVLCVYAWKFHSTTPEYNIQVVVVLSKVDPQVLWLKFVNDCRWQIRYSTVDPVWFAPFW